MAGKIGMTRQNFCVDQASAIISINKYNSQSADGLFRVESGTGQSDKVSLDILI